MANEWIQNESQRRGLEEVGIGRREKGGEGVRRVRERDKIGCRVGN